MTILEHWQTQKDALRIRIQDASGMADVVYEVRHALLQTEQNVLAEMSDEVLRQQSGILFGCIKNAIGLMEVQMASQVWVPQRSSAQKPAHSRLAIALSAAALLLLLTLYCYAKGLVLGAVLSFCSLILGGFAVWFRPAPSQPLQDEARVTLRPDVDRLFSILDGQMRSIDHYVNDFSYLNDQLRCGSTAADDASLSRAADLMEALYECAEEERAPAEDAARKLLASMGFCALDYSSQNSRYFNALPSKTTTRTLSPAIVSIQDQRLLRRGTAAVCNGAA